MISLRGGGCGTSTNLVKPDYDAPKPQQIEVGMPSDFSSNIRSHTDKINSMTETNEAVLNSLQFFFYNERIFHMLVENQDYASRYVDLLQTCITDLLTTSARLMKSNGLYCNLAMQIAAWMCKIVFWFYASNTEKKREMTMEVQQGFLSQVALIEQQLQIENTIHETAIKYELSCIKTIFTVFPNNSTEGQDILIQFAKGAFESLITMKISDDLTSAMKRGVKFAANEGYKLYLKNQYKKIFQIEKLKWQVIDAVQQDKVSMRRLAQQLSDMYKSIISSSWEIHYCWIKSIGSIICTKPMYSIKDIRLNEELFKQLKLQKAVILLDREHFLINLNVQKMFSQEAQELYRQIIALNKLSDLQNLLINGNNLIPKFEQYGNKLQEAQEASRKIVTPTQYFGQLFQNIKLDTVVKRMEDIQKDIFKLKENSSIYTTAYTDKLTDQFLEHISLAKEGINLCLQKMQDISLFYQQIVFIAQQWDLFITENSDPTLFQNDPFMIKLKLSQIELIKIDETFKDDYLKLKSGPYQNQQLKAVKVGDMSQNQLEFAMQFRLWQLVRLMEIHKKNISILTQIKIKINFLSEILGNQDQIPSVIQETQEIVKKEIESVITLPIGPASDLHDMLKMLNSVEMEAQKRNFSVLPEDAFKLHQVIQYDARQVFQIDIVLKSYAETYKQFTTIDLNSSQIISILSIQLTKLKQSIERLNNQIQVQENFKIRVIDLMKTVQYKIAKQQNLFNDFQLKISKQLEIAAETKKNNTMDCVKNCVKLANEQSQLTSQHYGELLQLNPYDIQAQKDFDREEQALNGIQKSLQLIIELDKKKPDKFMDYINGIIAKLRTEVKGSTSEVAIANIKEDLKEEIQPKHEQMIKSYEEQYTTLKKLLKSSLGDISQMELDLKMMKEVQSACLEAKISTNWINNIQLYKQENFNKLINFKLEYLEIQYQVPFKVNPNMLMALIEQIFPPDQTQSIGDMVQSFLNSDKIRIKECMATQLFKITESCIKQNVKIEVDLMILRMKAYETDKKLRRILTSNEYGQQVSLILQQHWPSQQETIVQEVKSGMKILNSLLYELQQENDAEKKKKIKEEYRNKENEIQEQLQNVSEIGNALGITMLFIRDLKKDLVKIDQKINEIQESIKSMNNDLSYLRGKTVYQLLDIRKNQILRNKKLLDAKTIYIKIRCVEKQFDDAKKTSFDAITYLYNQDAQEKEGEVNEFLTQQKMAMLVHGPAGSGKSTASRKIEEYIWEMYEKSSERDCRLIPIVVQLPQLQDPRHSAMAETLKSDAYKFDVNQIRELKEQMEQQKLKLLIIMDSYDEVHQDHIGSNLLKSNKLSGWGQKLVSNYPKIIITTRSEILNKADYHEWFLPEGPDTTINYKEVRLERFDKKQRNTYIDQYLNLSVKRVIYDTYYLMTNSQNEFQMFEQFTSLWDSLKIEFNQSKDEQLLSQQQIGYLQDSLLADKYIQIDSVELKRTLQVQLSELKSGDFYKSTIAMMNIEHILETPFMMEIVVQVLPTLIKQKSQQEYVKYYFIETYSQMNQKFNTENKDFNDQKASEAWNELVKDQTFFEDFSIVKTEAQIKKKLTSMIKDATKLEMYIKSLLAQKLTQYDFYQSFFELYFEKQIGKLKEQGLAFDFASLVQELWKFAKELAVELSKQTKTQVEYKAQGLIYKKENKSWEDDYFDDAGDKGVYKKMFRSCIPLKQQNNSYCFSHKSLQEFLVAKEILDKLRAITQQSKGKPDEYEVDELAKLKDHFINKCSWSIDFMKGTCSFIIQKAHRTVQLRELMFKAVGLTKEGEMIFLGSNCLFLLSRMTESFMDKDIQGIQIQSIDLTGSNFAHCNLDKTKFTDVNISGINVFQSSLKNVKWNSIQVSQLPPKSIPQPLRGMLYTKELELVLQSENTIWYEGSNKSLLETKSQIVNMQYYQDKIYAQEEKALTAIDRKKNHNQIENLTQKIIKIRFSQKQLYVLLANSDILVYELKDFSSKKYDFKTKFLEQEKAEAKVTNFWVSGTDLTISTSDLYQLKFNENYKVSKLSKIYESSGKCKYFPQYKLLQTGDKVVPIDPTKEIVKVEVATKEKKIIGKTKDQEGIDDNKLDKEQSKDQQQINKPIQSQNNIQDSIQGKTPDQSQLKQELKPEQSQLKHESISENKNKVSNEESQEKSEVEESGAKVSRKVAQNPKLDIIPEEAVVEAPKEINKTECRIIKLNQSPKEFLLWSKNELELYSIDLISKKQISHQLDKFLKKRMSEKEETLITVHSSKVGIWNLKNFELIQVINSQVDSCAIYQNKILAMSKDKLINYQDLKSLTSSKQLNFKDVYFAQRSQNFIGVTVDYDIYFFHSQSEIKYQQILKGKPKFVFFQALGERVLISLEGEKIFRIFECLKNKETTKYAFANKNTQLRDVQSQQARDQDIFFLKGAQLYKLEQNIASIVSPIKIATVEKSRESVIEKNPKKNQKQAQKGQPTCVSLKIIKNYIYATINGSFIQYSLEQNIQQQSKVLNSLNVTKYIICKNNKAYQIVDDKQIYNGDNQLVYSSRDLILQCIELEAYHGLVVAHKSVIRLLEIKDDEVEPLTINIEGCTCLFNTDETLFIGQKDAVQIYDFDTNEIINTIQLDGVPKIITHYYYQDFAILVNDKVFIWNYLEDELPYLSQKHGNCQDIKFINHKFVTRDEKAFFYQINESKDPVLSSKEDYLKWSNISIEIRNQKIYIYGILNNQVVRQHINTEKSSNIQVMLSFEVEYENVRGFDISNQLVAVYNDDGTIFHSKDLKNYQRIEHNGACKSIAISNDDLYLLVSNEQNQLFLYDTKKNQLKMQALQFESLTQALYVDVNEILIETDNQGTRIFQIYNYDTEKYDTVAALQNDYIQVGSTLNGFNIANRDSSIDIYGKRKYIDHISKQSSERYVRVQVFNNSSSQPIQSYQTDCTGAEIESHNGLSLVELFHQK